MNYWLIPLITVGVLIILGLSVSLVCFFTVFYSKGKPSSEEYPLPKGKIYEEFYPQMIEWMKEFRSLPHEDIVITSHDGLKLHGKYFEYEKGTPIEILFHGYRGSALRDLCGSIYRCHKLKRNALVVDQRGAGESEGHVITFGVKESRDCLLWVNYAIENIDKNAKIIITGISMGATTVLLAAGNDLPQNVVGALADCGYSSAKAIIKKVMGDMRLPTWLFYPFVRLGAILYGGFDPNAASATEAMKRCRIPVMFIHGDADDFVPSYMSEENYAACASQKKKIVITKGAGHGLCFPKNQEEYFRENSAFFTPILEENGDLCK